MILQYNFKVVYLEGSSTSTAHQIQFPNVSGLFTFRRLNGPLSNISIGEHNLGFQLTGVIGAICYEKY